MLVFLFIIYLLLYKQFMFLKNQNYFTKFGTLHRRPSQKWHNILTRGLRLKPHHVHILEEAIERVKNGQGHTPIKPLSFELKAHASWITSIVLTLYVYPIRYICKLQKYNVCQRTIFLMNLSLLDAYAFSLFVCQRT